jgi:hypothetical protein
VIALWDQDFLAKIAGLDLIEPVADAIGARGADIHVLPGAVGRFSEAPRYVRKYGLDTVRRARAVVDAASKISRAVPVEALEKLRVDNGRDRINDDDPLLLYHAAEEPNAILLTGDKSMLRALASTPAIADIAGKLSGRVVCLEQALAIAFGALGFSEACRRAARLHSTHPLDSGLSCIFGSQCSQDEASARMAVQSYVGELPAALLSPRVIPWLSGVQEGAAG